MSAPVTQLFPVKLLWKRILLLQASASNITQGTPINIQNGTYMPLNIPFTGKLIIFVSVSESGTLTIRNGSYSVANNGGEALNNGNALSAGIWYEFDIPVSAGMSLFFFWQPSSSSTTTTNVEMYVYLELEGCEESGSE